MSFFKEMEIAIQDLETYLTEKEMCVKVDTEATFPRLCISYKNGFQSGGCAELGQGEPYRGTARDMWYHKDDNITEYKTLDDVPTDTDYGFRKTKLLASCIASYDGLSFGDVVHVSTSTVSTEEYWAGEEDAAEMIESDKGEGIDLYVEDSEALIYIGEAGFIKLDGLTEKHFQGLRTTAALINQGANDALGITTGMLSDLLKVEEV